MLVYDLGLLDGYAVVFDTHFQQGFGRGTSFGCILVDNTIGSCNLGLLDRHAVVFGIHIEHCFARGIFFGC